MFLETGFPYIAPLTLTQRLPTQPFGFIVCTEMPGLDIKPGQNKQKSIAITALEIRISCYAVNASLLISCRYHHYNPKVKEYKLNI